MPKLNLELAPKEPPLYKWINLDYQLEYPRINLESLELQPSLFLLYSPNGEDDGWS